MRSWISSRKDGSLVHPLRGNIQTPGASGPLLGSKLVPQLFDQPIRSVDLAPKIPRGFCQARADAVAKLFGSGIRKGHNENLRRQ